MDPNVITNSGAFVAVVAIVAVVLVALFVGWIIRRSTARMARRNRAWIDQLPVSTGSRTERESTVTTPPEDTQPVLR